MDITRFLIKKDDKPPDEKQKLTDIISSIYKKKTINFTEYMMMINHIKNNCVITQTSFTKELFEKLQNPVLNLTNYWKLHNKFFTMHNNKNRVVTNIIVGDSPKYNDWTFSQKNAIVQVVDFLFSEFSTFGLYGYAGTGKTTLVTYLINFLLKNNLINSIVETSPTNKAVNILRSKGKSSISKELEEKVERKEKTLEFTTIHKLLKYENDFDADGKRIFVKKKAAKLGDYDMIIVDECSMLSRNIIKDLYADIKDTKKYLKKNVKIIFVGDGAQLCPVKETISPLFIKDSEFKPDKTITMDTVIRTKNPNIIGLCNHIRDWVLDNISSPKIFKYVGPGVSIYKDDKKWLAKFMEVMDKNSIILSWTNHRTKYYNDEVRRQKFKKEDLKRFEVGDKIMMNDFYKIPEEPIVMADEVQKDSIPGSAHRFYSAEQLIIKSLEIISYQQEKFVFIFPGSARKIANCVSIEAKLIKTLDNINKYVAQTNNKQYKVWKLKTNKVLPDKISETEYVIQAIHEDSIETHKKNKQFAFDEITSFWRSCKSNHKESLDPIEKTILKPLWKENARIFDDPFADVDSGYGITTHSSQSSTYWDVFIDTKDMLNNRVESDCKRLIYTAMTRVSNSLFILV